MEALSGAGQAADQNTEQTLVPQVLRRGGGNLTEPLLTFSPTSCPVCLYNKWQVGEVLAPRLICNVLLFQIPMKCRGSVYSNSASFDLLLALGCKERDPMVKFQHVCSGATQSGERGLVILWFGLALFSFPEMGPTWKKAGKS